MTKGVLHEQIEETNRFLAHWEAYRRVSLPLHNLVSDAANPHYMSDPLLQPLWDHRSTGQL